MKRPPAFPDRRASVFAHVGLLLLLTACRLNPAPAPTAESIRSPTVAAEPTLTPSPTLTAEPTHTPRPSPSAQPTATATPIPLPSPTELAEVTLSVPDSWRERAAAAITEANAQASGYTWRLAENETADVVLTNDGAGIAIVETALALAVPFTTEWEAIILSEAERIVQEGHEMVTLMPWDEMTPDKKALRIDGLGPADPAYPLRDSWSLAAEPQWQQAASDLAATLRGQGKAVVHMTAVGDINLDRSLGYALQQGNLAYPFIDTADALRGADITVGNIESALGDSGEPAAKRYPFRAPPQAAPALAEAGFDVVSLANNHGMDYGPEALMQALALLGDEGIAVVGAGPDAQAAHQASIIDVNGLRVAFLGYVNVPVEASTGFDTATWAAGDRTPGLAWGDAQAIRAGVSAVRSDVDLVIVLLHSGFEYQTAPSEPQREAARAAIDAGADLVIGHHAHILQGIEYYRDGVIIYGTGNFAFDIDGPPETALFHIWLDADGVREIEIEPALVQFGGQPRLAAPWEAQAIRNRVYRLTNLLAAE